MILQGLREKSNKKYLNKLLAERTVNVNNNRVISLGVILNIDEIDDFEAFRKLAEYIKVRPNKLKIIAYSPSKKNDLNSWDECYNPKDFGWKGIIKNIELQSFIDTEFDVLISYYEKEILELKLITAQSKSKFKIGILQSDERLNDLIIKTNLKQFNLFKEEVFKYLNIFKKIK
ncbi:MAG: hypothetical protein P8K68_12855 [Algibacter sp.]|uniref:DUF6913 domain-containing protein n=1 Tax=Algibacter sp. TaxID=1872428 RepID=UPI002626B6C9|nr:hypothetical protein [Algibacter sp.]MDG1729079.1 hypothetical protein [Algibacter sp.]MDG2179655.1 hypothetical protein [Algibacter sp.]